MKLKELLKADSSNEVLYIGSRTGFLLIGTAGYCLDHLTSVSIRLIEDLKKSRTACEKECGQLRSKLSAARNKYIANEKALTKNESDTLELMDVLKGNVTKDERTVLNRTLKSLKETHSDLVKDKEVINSQITYYKETLSKSMMRGHRLDIRIQDFTYLSEREVNSTYKKIQYDEPGTVVLIEGDEEGRYWSHREWKEDPENNPGRPKGGKRK